MEDNSLYRIQVAVNVRFLADQSDEADNRHVFAYTITLTNGGEHAVQLLSRHWIITDANNHVQEVKGKGVVGEQPVIKPGQSFEYTSGTVLATQVGTMSGTYQMQVVDGGEFAVAIPQFVLSVPRVLH
ncbi:MAG: Co2+/Mg2+ efflux protein ApaG [Sideroxydans sp. GWF2_59_14]|nr:MAG: Co2+/Mg2+ efflux protein ApaG [Sideroxydans sp. GWF2_59_14]